MSDKMIYQDLRIIFMVIYGTGTRSFSSSLQFRTTLIVSLPDCAGIENKNR